MPITEKLSAMRPRKLEKLSNLLEMLRMFMCGTVKGLKAWFKLDSVSKLTLITELIRKLINWVQCLNRNRALTVPGTAPNGTEFVR